MSGAQQQLETNVTKVKPVFTSNNQHTQTIVNFLIEIGIEVEARELKQETFLPGILIDCGRLVIDESKLLYPGDLLHEAGHLAVVSPQRRAELYGNVATGDGSEEMPAIAWSWAALKYLGLEPEIVFHADGYRGASASIIENFSAGLYFGVPVLQWLGMTYEGEQADKHKVAPFPHMCRWLCERNWV